MTHPVAELRPNRWNLYGMHGNVMEWCWDRYAEYQRDVVDNPQGPKEETGTRVVRGGSFRISGKDCRPAIRSSLEPGHKSEFLGFRVAANQRED